MSPAHVSPSIPIRIVLIEQMILAIEINKAIGIVCPVFCRRKMKPRPVFLFVQIALGKNELACKNKHEQYVNFSYHGHCLRSRYQCRSTKYTGTIAQAWL